VDIIGLCREVGQDRGRALETLFPQRVVQTPVGAADDLHDEGRVPLAALQATRPQARNRGACQPQDERMPRLTPLAIDPGFHGLRGAACRQESSRSPDRLLWLRGPPQRDARVQRTQLHLGGRTDADLSE
jgi:hypothetical protein